MRFIQLSMVTGSAQVQNFSDDTDDGEDDGVARIGAPLPEETTVPTMVAVHNIRNFYPRKPDRMGRARTGTRISFTNGSGMAVTETFEAVSTLVNTH